MAGYIGPRTADVPIGTISTKGTVSANSVVVGTNNVTIGNAVYVAANGNVGLGKSSPSYPLYVATTGGGQIAGFEATSSNGFYTAYFSNAATVTGYIGTANRVASGSNTDFGFGTPGNTGIFLSTNNSVKMYVAANGGVGIGTITPQSSLDITATSADSVLSLTAAGTRRFQLKSLTSTAALTIHDEGASLERMRVNSSGYFGFNTGSTLNGRYQFNIGGTSTSFAPTCNNAIGSNDQTRFHITGSEPSVLLTSDISPTTGTQTGASAYNLGMAIGFYAINDVRSQIFWSNSPLTFTSAANTSAAPTERMRIDTLGNIGIGGAPSNWYTLSRAIQFGSGSLNTYNNDRIRISQNAYVNTSGYDVYYSNGPATQYRQYNGQHDWWIATSGTANANCPFIQAMTLDSNGTLSLAYGQIKFPASQNASSDANTLDDYEEGTFTPVFTNAGNFTYSRQTGNYTKVGNLVTVWIDLVLSSQSSGSGVITIGGFPFNKANFNGSLVMPVFGDNNWTTPRSNLVCYNVGATTWQVYYNSGNNITSTNITDIGQSGRILISGSYYV